MRNLCNTRVNATNVGGTSSWSTTNYLRTAALAPPMPVEPANDTTNQAVSCKFYWTSVTGATLYNFQISTDSSFNSTPFYSKDSIIDTTEIVSILSKGTTYYWRVNAENAVGTGLWSRTGAFTTVPDKNKGFCGIGSWLALIPPVGWRFVNGLKRLFRRKPKKVMKPDSQAAFRTEAL